MIKLYFKYALCFFLFSTPLTLLTAQKQVKKVQLASKKVQSPPTKAQSPSKKTVTRSYKPLTHQDIFNKKLQLPKQKTMAAEVVALGKSFLSEPYPKSKIDTTKRADGSVKLQPISEEVLVVNLKTFDCVTFAESMVTLAQTRRDAKPSYDGFKKHLAGIRYRKSDIDYAARFHYFSDWLYENEKRGVVKIITKDLGGVPLDKTIFYMSYKKDTLYGNMADPVTYANMKKVEDNITKREKWYIPKAQVADIEDDLKEGDIIGITNRLEGMDMAHVGIVVKIQGQTRMMHASSKYNKVVITEGSISEYLMKNRMQTGIMVARL
jgi:Protein of unknown function (DUF1460)